MRLKNRNLSVSVLRPAIRSAFSYPTGNLQQAVERADMLARQPYRLPNRERLAHATGLRITAVFEQGGYFFFIPFAPAVRRKNGM
jgi:hypothetical protein